jgi:hypothetical protein
MCMSTPSPPPPTPSPVAPPRPFTKVEKIENVKLAQRKKTARRGGQRSLTINRTAPSTGTTGSGAKAY